LTPLKKKNWPTLWSTLYMHIYCLKAWKWLEFKGGSAALWSILINWLWLENDLPQLKVSLKCVMGHPVYYMHILYCLKAYIYCKAGIYTYTVKKSLIVIKVLLALRQSVGRIIWHPGFKSWLTRNFNFFSLFCAPPALKIWLQIFYLKKMAKPFKKNG
jgi:hypothetical protein